MGVRGTSRLVATAQRFALFLGTLFLCFLVIETAYRLFDPFPFFSPEEVNSTDHGNLSEYDETLGWRGVPEGRAVFVTPNNRVWLQHNRDGFRDVEHGDLREKKPAVVFLGDSFTWGYEVEFDDMFVNRLRQTLPDFTVFNLAHRGYGTDQELLTFKRWDYDGPLRWVVLMFCENDVQDNNSNRRYHKPKPRYQVVDDELILTGVPVPKLEEWDDPPRPELESFSWPGRLKRGLSHSHFLHDLIFRYELARSPRLAGRSMLTDPAGEDLGVTARLLRELEDAVERRGAKLIVVFIPSIGEIEHLNEFTPYQSRIAELTETLGIQHLDLAPSFEGTWQRTYYRVGMHWNARGNRVAADAIYDYLSRVVSH